MPRLAFVDQDGMYAQLGDLSNVPNARIFLDQSADFMVFTVPASHSFEWDVDATLAATLSTTEFGLPDNVSLELGTDDDTVLRHRAATLAADTALTDVLAGTPVSPALAANSSIISNVTANGDLLLAVNTGTNSHGFFFADASAQALIFNDSAGDWDFRYEGDTNANLLVLDGGTDSVASGAAVTAGSAFTLSNLTSRTLVTAVGNQVHVPAGSLTDSGATGTIAVMAPVFVGARTVVATNTITYTDVAAIRAIIPAAGAGSTFTRTYGLWTDGQVRADNNFQVGNTNTFGTTQPTRSVVFTSGTEAAGSITSGGAISTDGTVMRKIIANGTASNIET